MPSSPALGVTCMLLWFAMQFGRQTSTPFLPLGTISLHRHRLSSMLYIHKGLERAFKAPSYVWHFWPYIGLLPDLPADTAPLPHHCPPCHTPLHERCPIERAASGQFTGMGAHPELLAPAERCGPGEGGQQWGCLCASVPANLLLGLHCTICESLNIIHSILHDARRECSNPSDDSVTHHAAPLGGPTPRALSHRDGR